MVGSVGLLQESQIDEWKAPETARTAVNPISPTPEALKRGQSLFRRHCTVCHGKGGLGDGPAARPRSRRSKAPKNLTQPDLQARLSDGEIFWKISNGFRKDGRIIMPSFTEDVRQDVDRWKVVLFVRSLGEGVQKR